MDGNIVQLDDNFNPPSPCGEGPRIRHNMTDPSEFQSTLPMRGGTKVCRKTTLVEAISIHPPHAGRDSVLILPLMS